MSTIKKRPRILPSSILEQSTESIDVYAVPGLEITDHMINVPLDYSGCLPGTIDVFFRVICHRNTVNSNLPYLLYLQGGPGFEAPRPLDCTGWLKTATNYFNVVLMDQRGTGHSTPITCRNLVKISAPEDQAKYLKCFRSDSIIRDSELIREFLFHSRPIDDTSQSGIQKSIFASPSSSRQKNVSPRISEKNDKKWSILGQSFGGFCCFTYLSFAPDSLTEVLITGGIPPGIQSTCSADDVYRKTFKRVILQNEKFYTRYPTNIKKVQKIIQYLADQPNGSVLTPSGNIFSPRSFQLLGLNLLGFSHGFERLHYLLYYAFENDGHLSFKFLKEFDMIMSWDTNPLYAILHEAIYCQAGGGSSRWAAHRIRESEFKKEFDALSAVKEDRPVYFTGEMVFPWIFDEFIALRGIKEAADIIAHDTEWTQLYNTEVLKNNTVPTAAATYYEDMFVDFDLAQESASLVKGLRQHITNEYLHDGIRENGVVLMEQLLNMVRDGVLVR